MATANEGPMNGHPVRQPGGVVAGRDENGKSATVDESAVGRKPTFMREVRLAIVAQQETLNLRHRQLQRRPRIGDRSQRDGNAINF